MTRPRRERLRSLAAVTVAGLVASGLVVVHGCTVVNGLVAPPRESPITDSDAGESTGSATDAGDGCDHARVPSEPILTADPPGGLDLLFAFKNTVKFAKEVGFDLDGVCTCTNGAPDTCRVSSATAQCDQSNGRDNVMAGVLKTLQSTGFDLEKRINDLITNGKSGMLVRMHGYSGEADDPNVQVSFYGSRGVCTDAGAPAAGSQQVPNCTKPSFDANDRWNYDPTQLIGPDGGDVRTSRSRLFATGAYVKGGVLVARLDGALPLADLALTLNGGVMVARIAKDPWRLEQGLVAGRWPVAQAFDGIRQLRSGDNGPALCKDPVLAAVFNKAQVCAVADIMETPSGDRTGKTCNAVSMGMTFEAAPASFGEPFTAVITEDCPPATFGECE